MVDLATLTGAIIIGLGHEYAGMFSNDDALAQKLTAAGQATGEKVWRMPLDEAYDKQIKSDIADMKNVGGRPAGSITAAQFIQRFVNSKPWAHLDIAGMAWSTKDAPTRAEGRDGVRRAAARPAGGGASRGLTPLAEIGFYHLTRTGPDEALPRLLGRTLAAGERALVLCGSEARRRGTRRGAMGEPRPGLAAARHGTRRRRGSAADLADHRGRGAERRALPVPDRRRGKRAARCVRARVRPVRRQRRRRRWRRRAHAGARRRRRATR